MRVLNSRSLAGTIDRINDALFFGRRIPKREVRSVAEWLAGRRGLPGSYAGMFAPTPRDFAHGIKLFTGERISSGAATGHILGEEACRALLRLDADVPAAEEALARATRSMDKRLSQSEAGRGRRGFFCCGACTASVWRHLAAGGLSRRKERFAGGLKFLKGYRDGEGRWRRFPFHYTLLALSEMDGKAVTREIEYAAPVLERMLKRRSRGGKYETRRRTVAERLLARL